MSAEPQQAFYRGRRQATAEANMTAAEGGKLRAHGVATCMILEFGIA